MWSVIFLILRIGDLIESLSGSTHESYDPQWFSKLFTIEDRHFWFQARNRIIAIVVNQIVAKLPSGYRILEVGSGTGNTLRVLEASSTRGTVVGMDLFSDGLQFARHRVKSSLVQGDLHTPPFRVRFDLIGLFDVLEHIPDDVQVLRDLRDLVSPNGVLLMTVPAHPSLWSYFDEASHHCRRYTLEDMASKLKSAGFRIEYMTQYMASLFPGIWLGRRLARLRNSGHRSRKTGSNDLAANKLKIVPVLNEFLTWVLVQEGHLIERRYKLPMGASLLIVARRVD